jgi:hypothetical protein
LIPCHFVVARTRKERKEMSREKKILEWERRLT